MPKIPIKNPDGTTTMIEVNQVFAIESLTSRVRQLEFKVDELKRIVNRLNDPKTNVKK
jgi:hypothetical protein